MYTHAFKDGRYYNNMHAKSHAPNVTSLSRDGETDFSTPLVFRVSKTDGKGILKNVKNNLRRSDVHGSGSLKLKKNPNYLKVTQT